MRALVLAALTGFTALCAAASAAPFNFTVAAGSPPDLATRVSASFAPFASVSGVNLSVTQSAGAALVYAVGDAGIPMNPDEITRTLVTPNGVQVNIAPNSPIAADVALPFEAGLRLGLNVPAAVDASSKIADAETKLLQARYGRTGDMNGDGKVDVQDLEILAANSGKSINPGGPPLAGDLNGDGVVNDADLTILQEHFDFDAPFSDGTSNTSPASPATPAGSPPPVTTPSSPTPQGAPATPASPGGTPPGGTTIPVTNPVPGPTTPALPVSPDPSAPANPPAPPAY